MQREDSFALHAGQVMSIYKFVRSLPTAVLEEHLTRAGVLLEGTAAETPEAEFRRLVRDALNDLEGKHRDRVHTIIDRICAMDDEPGQVAMVSLPQWRDSLLRIDGAIERAQWLHSQSPRAFRTAEEIRHADENRDAQRGWDAFVGPPGKSPNSEAAAVEAFKHAIAPLLMEGRVKVYCFPRTRADAAGEPETVSQVTIYSHDAPVDDLVFDDDNDDVRHQPRKPVIETTVVYDLGSGAVEVAGKMKASREKVAAAFAKHLLGSDLPGERLPARRLDLSRLPQTKLSHEVADGIAKIKLTLLAASTPDRSVTATFQVPFDGDETLLQVTDAELGPQNPLRRGWRIWRARIEILFEPDEDQKRGKKINLELTYPSGCNIRGKTRRERLLLNRYLPAWGLRLSA